MTSTTNRDAACSLLRRLADALERRDYGGARQVIRELKSVGVPLLLLSDLDAPSRPPAAGAGRAGR